MARDPQGAPPVVERFAVTMIDERPPPLACHVEPRQLVRAVVAAVDTNPPIIRSRAKAGDISGAVVRSFAHAPSECSGPEIVVQEFVQPFLLQLGFFHRGLANKKGPQAAR